MKNDPRKRYSLTSRFEYGEGSPVLYDGLLPRRVETKAGYILHTVVEGDRLDRLAHNYYGDPRLWWAIAQANPGLVAASDLLFGTATDSRALPIKIGLEIQVPPKPLEAE